MSKQSETYTIDHPNIGNVMYRKDNLTNQYENFAYDNLDRLTGISYNGGASQAITYAANGNITSKYGSGSFLYGAKPHAVASVTIYPPGPVSQDYQDVTYTPFNKVSNIAQRTPATRKLFTYDITYGPDEQRVKTIYTDTTNTVTTRYYAGNYEKEVIGTNIKQVHYINATTGLVGVYIKWNTGGVLKDTLYYVCTDRQGSITALLRPNFSIAEKYSYDAWGRRRNPAWWSDYNVKAPKLINRGYTGHEMLDAFGLINMNGRMYDPVIGRILSPDKYVQSPTNTQSYNRYTYCFNNPLKYTDPSGWIAPESDGPEVVWNVPGLWSGTKGGVGPGNGYWSDFIRSETDNYNIMSRSGFDNTYGAGASAIVHNLMNDPAAFAKWQQGLTSVAKIQEAGGYWVQKSYASGGETIIRDKDDNLVKINLPTTIIYKQWISLKPTAGQGGIDPSITAGIAVGGGMIGGLEQSYKYGNHSVNYAQEVLGKVRNPSVLTRANQMNATKMASGLKVVGRGVTGLSVAASGYQFFNSDMSGNDYARLTGSLIITGTAFIPIVGPVISIGLGVADSSGAFDGIYNYFD